MNTSARSTARLLVSALRALLVLTVVTGVIYPLVVTGIAQGAFSDKANGSKAEHEGRTVGSKLIGQSWNLEGTDKPDPHWFQPRPSNSAYDPLTTGSSQLGASDPTLLKSVKEARQQVAAFNDVPVGDVPKDAVTGSGSAIDPHISPAYAELQIDRVAKENGLSEPQVEDLVNAHKEGRDLGFLGNERVNVLELNLALDELANR
ncbi:potassium-transporting ATPase subunit KdpC [Streptomyces sp. WMMC500]|uniref:potassium-transporting ATPase subunit KdpC n=1 Tax=Streptomyces sp. WMMC500 TaxID=3015154 RepID=UPI00248C9F4B|nr:potassium-transporting ATPase subunit KdpC [Streptomyces sp. WMMC500]WBB58099.1 potassium-transporting ATPase subunit KdpC [Streptomyces sp. WMMC500]